MTLQSSGSERRLWAQIEHRRLQLQAELDAARTRTERNRSGQFATPPALAREILASAVEPLGQAPVRFLDPAFGTGAFYYALLTSLPAEQIAAAVGYEVDPHYGAPARDLWRPTGLVLHLEDFTKAAPPPADSGRFNLIVCNPPYVRHHHLAASEKERLRRLCRETLGLRPDGLSGLYCYFLALCHQWLCEGGLGIWLVPSEFMDVNYGSWVTRYLADRVTLQWVHRFEPGEVQFGDALVSSAVLCLRKAGPGNSHEVKFSFGGAPGRPRLAANVPLATLRSERKWTRFPGQGQRDGAGYVLGDFFEIKRGLATGDNSYFVLRAPWCRDLGLPRRFLRPILPSPRYVTGHEVLADQEGNPITEPRLFLLDCALAEEAVRQSCPALWKYLEEGRKRGLPDRYLCRHRRPWYSQERRPPAPIVATYMGRSGVSRSPFRFIRNRSKATAANVYLLMYPKGALLSAVHVRPGLVDGIWAILNRLDPRALLDEGRVYGGGLHKLEPRELANVAASDIAALLGLPPRRAQHQLELISFQARSTLAP